jgi:hypothetical protein
VYRVRRESSGTFREKREGNVRQLMSLQQNKNFRDFYRGINEFKKGCQPRTNLLKDENGDPVAHSHDILNGWKNVLVYSMYMLLTVFS